MTQNVAARTVKRARGVAAGVCAALALGAASLACAAEPAAAPAATAPSDASTAAASAPAAAPKKAPGRKAAAVDPASVDPKVKTGAGRNSRALDRLDLETTQITGNRELPKVMVVVPWKKSDIGDLVGRPVNSLVDEALQPVDREVFRREVDYYGALAPDSRSTGPAATPPNGGASAPATRSETGVTPEAGSGRPEK